MRMQKEKQRRKQNHKITFLDNFVVKEEKEDHFAVYLRYSLCSDDYIKVEVSSGTTFRRAMTNARLLQKGYEIAKEKEGSYDHQC